MKSMLFALRLNELLGAVNDLQDQAFISTWALSVLFSLIYPTARVFCNHKGFSAPARSPAGSLTEEIAAKMEIKRRLSSSRARNGPIDATLRNHGSDSNS